MLETTLVQNLLKHQATLEGMLTAMVGDAIAAQDLYQEMALIMTRKREEVTEDCAFLAWARKIGFNVVRDYRKKMARRKVRLMQDGVLDQVAAAFEETPDAFWEARGRALEKCMETLPERSRTVIRRRYLEAVPSEELAASLNTNRNALDALLFRIRRALLDCVQARLEKEGAV
jgi:RNA polymerase sigma-70 factor (ECF subfamily)